MFSLVMQVHQEGEVRALIRTPPLRFGHQAVRATQRPPQQHLCVPIQRHGECRSTFVDVAATDTLREVTLE